MMARASDDAAAAASNEDKLLKACADGNVEDIEDLLRNDSSLQLNTAKNADGDTAVHVAAAADHVEVLKLLHAKGVDVNLANARQDTALHHAAKVGQLSSAVYLVEEAQTKIDSRNDAGQTPLHLAARGGHTEVVEWLCHRQAPLDIQDNRGCTALYLACEAGKTFTAHALIQFNCDLNLLDKTGASALHISCRENLLSVVQSLCAAGCNVDSKTEDGMTPLHIAAKSGNAELVRYLVLSGADIDEYNQVNAQAEDIARAQGCSEVADMLSKLTSSIVRDRGEMYRRQLGASGNQFARVRLLLLGHSGVGKSTLVESLKCGYIRSLFRRSGATLQGQMSRRAGASGKMTTLSQPKNVQYTRGINVQQVNISAAGDVSIWDFSGVESYYGTYDKFLGDPNAIYMVVVSLKDSITERRRQVDFWLNFITTRMVPVEPIGFGGNKLWAPRTMLIMTHADADSSSSSSWKASDAELYDQLQQQHSADVILEPHIFRLDSNQANGAEMKLLRQAIASTKKRVVEGVFQTLGILDATLSILPDWRRALSAFPVVSWPTFVDYIRSRINILATEEHLRELVNQLHFIGEVVSVTREDQEMIVVNPQWLCTDIIGKLLSHDCFSSRPVDGRFLLQDVQSVFNKSDAQDIMFVLDALELCSASNQRGEPELTIGCFITSPPPPTDPPPTDEEVVGGFVVIPEFANQLRHVFSRIIFALRVRLQRKPAPSSPSSVGTSDAQDCSIQQWLNGAKVVRGPLSATITLTDAEGRKDQLTVTCRGPVDHRRQLFFFQEDVCETIYASLERTCPALYLERAPVSVLDLRAGLPASRVHVYIPRTVILAQLDGTSVVRRGSDSSQTEQLSDIIAYGCDDVWACLNPGMDQHVTALSLYARYRLAVLLDQKDWLAVGKALGLEIQYTDDELAKGPLSIYSMTDELIADWVHTDGPAATIRALYSALQTLQRADVVDAMLSLTPLYRYVSSDNNNDIVLQGHQGRQSQNHQRQHPMSSSTNM